MVLKHKVQGHIEELSHHIKTSFGVAGSRVSLFVFTGAISTLNPAKDFHSWDFWNNLRQKEECSQRSLEAPVRTWPL